MHTVGIGHKTKTIGYRPQRRPIGIGCSPDCQQIDPAVTYQPDKRVMFKIKHERTADCVVAGYRVHKSGDGAIGSLLLGLLQGRRHTLATSQSPSIDSPC